MEKTNTLLPYWTLAVVLAVFIGGYFYFSNKSDSSPVAENGFGKVYVTVSDVSADIQNVNDIAMTIGKVELHSATQGWVTVSSAPRSFNLLTLKASGKAELAGSANIAADTYDQTRATINKVQVKTKNAGTKTAVLVSKTLTIKGDVVVRAKESSRVNLDVKASNSLHTATNGDYVFAPVVVLESRHSADVNVQSDNSVVVSGGTLDVNTEVGTDISGNVIVGSELSPSVKINIVNDMPIMVTGGGTTSGSGLIEINTANTLNSGVNLGY